MESGYAIRRAALRRETGSAPAAAAPSLLLALAEAGRRPGKEECGPAGAAAEAVADRGEAAAAAVAAVIAPCPPRRSSRLWLLLLLLGPLMGSGAARGASPPLPPRGARPAPPMTCRCSAALDAWCVHGTRMGASMVRAWHLHSVGRLVRARARLRLRPRLRLRLRLRRRRRRRQADAEV
jgi:hypothetical protein